MREYIIEGPCLIPSRKTHSGGRFIDEHAGIDFWADNDSLRTRKGCYVFAIKTSRNFLPFYVGKATRGFAQEVFTHHKLHKYNSALADYQKGTPHLFFVVYPVKKGKSKSSEISKIEQFFIELAYNVNPEIRNINSIPEPVWSIKNVVRGRTTKPNQGEKVFKRMLGL